MIIRFAHSKAIVPNTYRWIAMDHDNVWYAYTKKPVYDGEHGVWEMEPEYEAIGTSALLDLDARQIYPPPFMILEPSQSLMEIDHGQQSKNVELLKSVTNTPIWLR